MKNSFSKIKNHQVLSFGLGLNAIILLLIDFQDDLIGNLLVVFTVLVFNFVLYLFFNSSKSSAKSMMIVYLCLFSVYYFYFFIEFTNQLYNYYSEYYFQMSDLNILIPHVWSRIILLFVYIYGTILVLKSPTEDIYALRKKITLLFVFSVITSLEILYYSFLNFRAVATSLDFVFQSFKQIPFLFLLEITNIGFFGEPNSEHNGLKQITNEDIAQTNIIQMTHNNFDLVNSMRLEVESERTVNNAIDNKRIEFLSPKRTISLEWKIIYTIILWVFWALFASAIFGDGPFGTIIQGIVQIGGTIFVWKQPSK